MPPLIGALGGAAGATKSVADAVQDVGINIASVSVLAFLVYRDLQVSRMVDPLLSVALMCWRRLTFTHSLPTCFTDSKPLTE